MEGRDQSAMGKGGGHYGQKEAREQEGDRQKGHTPRSRRGIGCNVREAKATLSNTAVRGLLGNGAFAKTALSFLREADVGKVKAEGRRVVWNLLVWNLVGSLFGRTVHGFFTGYGFLYDFFSFPVFSSVLQFRYVGHAVGPQVGRR